MAKTNSNVIHLFNNNIKINKIFNITPSVFIEFCISVYNNRYCCFMIIYKSIKNVYPITKYVLKKTT